MPSGESARRRKLLHDIDVSILGRRWQIEWPGAPAVARLVARLALATARVQTPAEISIVLASNHRIRRLNAKHRGVDRPTNVLAFPLCRRRPGAQPTIGGAGIDHLGDVVIAYETVVREAARQGKSRRDHFSHLVAHGVLHLLGYDHTAERSAKTMERLEVKLLKKLRIKNPYRPVLRPVRRAG